MKKIVTLCLTLAMLVSLSLAAFAAPGAFVSSPSGNAAPILVGYVPGTEGCNAELKIVSYAERNTLDEEDRLALEEAYNQIANHMQNNAFSKIIEQLAKENDMKASELSVSDLFDISYYGCDNHSADGHKGFAITLKAESLDDLVGLLHLNGETWEFLKVSEYDENEKTITFFVDNLSPFAIVVDNGSGELPPQTGDNSMIYLGVMAVAAAGLVIVLVSLKKRSA